MDAHVDRFVLNARTGVVHTVLADSVPPGHFAQAAETLLNGVIGNSSDTLKISADAQSIASPVIANSTTASSHAAKADRQADVVHEEEAQLVHEAAASLHAVIIS